MKYKTIPMLLLILPVICLQSQTIMDVARSKEITWYGIDFSKAKFIGFGDDITPSKLVDELIPAWATLTEETNFNTTYKTSVKKATAVAKKRNANLNKQSLLTNNFYEISPDSIEAIVSEYKSGGSGFGFVYIVESFEKTTDKAYIHVCFFKESDMKIISMRRYIGKTSGKKMPDRYQAAIISIIKSNSKDFKQYKKK